MANCSPFAGRRKTRGDNSMKTPASLLRISLLVVLVTALFWAYATMAQTETGTISGLITDETGASVPNAQVQLLSVQRGTTTDGKTNSSGIYIFTGVQPGLYQIKVQKLGFKQVDLLSLIVNVQDHIEQNIRLQVGSVSESVTVEANGLNINTTDGSVGTVVDRTFVENMPLNGRSFQSLILLAPGVTAVPGAFVGGAGEFSVNGQRTQTNYFTVDGVAANTGVAPTGGIVYGNGLTPAETALGTTHSLVSVDALQEFRITTSTYSAEYGRTPGAQISLETRSGMNAWHGSLFDYFRNDALDANNWFNNAAGFKKTAERQNDFGGTVGGPIEIPGLYHGRDKTFFFFSYEGLRLTVPQPAFTITVPDTYLRQNAPAAVQPLLDAFPIQNHPEVANNCPSGSCTALFTGTYSSPSSLDAYSIRVDHSFGGKLKVFGRYGNTPSHSLTREITRNPTTLDNVTSNVTTGTLGATSVFSPRFANELRFNYTRNNSGFVSSIDSFGGATPLTSAQLFPGITIPPAWNFTAAFGIGSFPSFEIAPFKTPQHQWNVTDSLTTVLGSHTLKYGMDYRRLASANEVNTLGEIIVYFGAAQNPFEFRVCRGLRNTTRKDWTIYERFRIC